MNLKKLLIEKLGGYATADDAINSMAPAEVVKKVGGYLTIEDAIEAIRAKELKERYTILTMAVKKLFNTIGPEDILHSVEGQWMAEGKTLSKGQRDLLMAEAAQFEKSYLFRVLRADILYQANKKLFVLSENVEHVVTAKFWLYTWDVMSTRIKSIVAGSAQFNHKAKN